MNGVTHLQIGSRTCPPCGPFVVDTKDLGEGPVCVRCGKPKHGKRNKYNAKRQLLDGYNYDSQFEASIAAELVQREKAGDILKWERQVPIAIYANGEHIMTSKVDFLAHHKDGSKELIEAKGREDYRYKIFRRLLEVLWLPLHPEYRYTVVKETNRSWRNWKPT